MIHVQSVKEILGMYNDRRRWRKLRRFPRPGMWTRESRNWKRRRCSARPGNWWAGWNKWRSRASSSPNVAGEPIVVVRGNDHILRAMYNVCRHHAAAVVTEPCGQAAILHCPYHGWNYGLDGSLKGMPEFDGVRNFERAEKWSGSGEGGSVGEVRIRESGSEGRAVAGFSGWSGEESGAAGSQQIALFRLAGSMTSRATGKFSWTTISMADTTCRILHKGLNSVLDYKEYTIENEDRYCLQSSPMAASEEDAATGATRKGDRAWYFWQYPNLMINCYEGYMDTNFVIPMDVDHCRVIFDFYFGDVSEAAREYNEQSVGGGRAHSGRRPGDLRGGAARIEVARLWSGEAFGPPRGRGAFVSSLCWRLT